MEAGNARAGKAAVQRYALHRHAACRNGLRYRGPLCYASWSTAGGEEPVVREGCGTDARGSGGVGDEPGKGVESTSLDRSFGVRSGAKLKRRCRLATVHRT